MGNIFPCVGQDRTRGGGGGDEDRRVEERGAPLRRVKVITVKRARTQRRDHARWPAPAPASGTRLSSTWPVLEAIFRYDRYLGARRAQQPPASPVERDPPPPRGGSDTASLGNSRGPRTRRSTTGRDNCGTDVSTVKFEWKRSHRCARWPGGEWEERVV